ncbi:MAG: TolC family protein, partial [Myxococcota bacterium]|nr:TolC family protein [Myxococcota bacterium]
EGSGFSVDVDWTEWGYFYRVRLSFTQPVTTFGRISSLRRAAKSGLEVGNAQISLARWELRYRAAQAYYGAVLASELRQILNEGKRWIAKAEERMERLRAEDSEEYDQMAHLRLKSRLTEFFEMEAQNQSLEVGAHEGLRALLSRASGHQVRPRDTRLTPLEWEEAEASEYVSRALKHRPDRKMARAGRDAKRALADAKAADLWPNVVIVGDARINDSDVIGRDSTILGPETLGFSAGLLLAMQWQLDIPDRMFLRDEARAEVRKASAQIEVQADLASVQIHRLAQDLRNKRRLIEAYRKANKAAQGWLTASWDLYDSGFGSFKEVMDALVQFYGKRVGYLRTVHEHNLLVHELSRAIGENIIREPAVDETRDSETDK